MCVWEVVQLGQRSALHTTGSDEGGDWGRGKPNLFVGFGGDFPFVTCPEATPPQSTAKCAKSEVPTGKPPPSLMVQPRPPPPGLYGKPPMSLQPIYALLQAMQLSAELAEVQSAYQDELGAVYASMESMRQHDQQCYALVHEEMLERVHLLHSHNLLIAGAWACGLRFGFAAPLPRRTEPSPHLHPPPPPAPPPRPWHVLS